MAASSGCPASGLRRCGSLGDKRERLDSDIASHGLIKRVTLWRCVAWQTLLVRYTETPPGRPPPGLEQAQPQHLALSDWGKG